MAETDLISVKPRGFAGLMAILMEPLKDDPKFKEKFKETERKFLINATNLNHAAIITINKGELIINSIPNKPKSNLKKKIVGWDAYISMDSQILIALAMKRISMIRIALKVLTRKVRMRGILKLFSLLKLFNILTG
jgi:hypothetical protein